MPNIDGLETTSIIRDLERGTGEHMPIVAMTAHAMPGDWDRCLEAGMDAYLTKPLDAGKLFETLDDLLAQAPTRMRVEDLLAVDEPVVADPPPVNRPRVVPLFDRDRALAQVEGDEDLLCEVASLFCQDSTVLADQLTAAVAAGDAATVEKVAHKLKGSVAIFGVPFLYDRLQRLETMGQEDRLAKAGPELEITRQALTALWGELERLQLAHKEAAARCGS